MIPISQRLRARHEPVGDGKGTWRKDGLCQEAADIIDALVEALDECKACGIPSYGALAQQVDAALALARGNQGRT